MLNVERTLVKLVPLAFKCTFLLNLHSKTSGVLFPLIQKLLRCWLWKNLCFCLYNWASWIPIYSISFFLYAALTEGDIVYDKRFRIMTGNMVGRQRRDTLSDRNFLWNNGVVPYAIVDDMCKYLLVYIISGFYQQWVHVNLSAWQITHPVLFVLT